MNCIDFTSKRSKMFSYVAKHSKLLQNYKRYSSQNYNESKRSKMFSYVAKHSNTYYNELHRFYIKTIKNVQNYKSIILQWIASILHQNDLKCSVTSQNIQNYAKLQKWSNHNELHRFDVKTIQTFELGRKTTKVIKL